jgi:hypothetical protein
MALAVGMVLAVLAPREASAYSYITHGRASVGAWDRIRPKLASRIGYLGNKNGGTTEKITYYRYRNAFVYGSCAADAGALASALQNSSLRALANKVLSELNKRRWKGHNCDLSLKEITPWPASSHSLEFALDYVLKLAWTSKTRKKEKICFAMGFVSHILQDNYDSLCDIPYSVARCGIGDFTFGQEFKNTAAIEVGGITNSGYDLFFPASKIRFGETSVGIKYFIKKPGFPPLKPVPVHRDWVVGFDLPGFMREALRRWRRDHGGCPVPTKLGLKNTFRIFHISLELLELPKNNWSKVLERFFKKHMGTAEFKIRKILGRKLTVLLKKGKIKFVYDLPGPWNIVKSISPSRIRLAGRRFLEGYAKGRKYATLLNYNELPSFRFLGLGLVKLQIRLKVQYRPKLRLLIGLRIAILGHGPTLKTIPIDLPKKTPQHFLDMGGRVMPLIGQAFYPGLNYKKLVQNDLEAKLALKYGFFNRSRYERYWLRQDPVSGWAMSKFTAAHCRYMADHAGHGDWSGDKWLLNDYWPFTCELARRQAVTQSILYRYREKGGTNPPYGSFPELMVFDVRYRRGTDRIYELQDLGADPVDVEVDLFSPCWTVQNLYFDLAIRIMADDPARGPGAKQVVAERTIATNLKNFSLYRRIHSHRGERISYGLRFTPDPKVYGYHVEVAAIRNGSERTFFTTDIEPFIRMGIERVVEGGIVGRRQKMDRYYSTFVPSDANYPGGKDIKSLRHNIHVAYSRPHPIGAPHSAAGLLAVESAGFYDGSYVKFRVGNHVERSWKNRGMNLLVRLPNGSLDRRSFDTHGQAGADQALINYLESLPVDTIVLLGIDDEATHRLQKRLTLRRILGSQALREVRYRDGWAIIAEKVKGSGYGSFKRLAEERVRQREGSAAVLHQLPLPPNRSIR